MQKLINDCTQYYEFISGLTSEGYDIEKSQESFQFPGIFFIYKYGHNVYIEPLDKKNIHYIQQIFDDLWK